jgi:hypothetical protein
MEALHPAYADALKNIGAAIQASDSLAAFIDEDDENNYKALCDEFEPTISAIYDQVANENPLMLESLENLLLDPDFESLFLPKILGYSVLRQYVNSNMKYVTPHNHYKDILLAICNSPNFEQIRKRIGQTTQIGFALSSDIWITNLIESIDNKKVKQFLTGQKSDVLRDLGKRKEAYDKYKKQFVNVNFFSIDFPTNKIQFVSNYPALKDFVLFRSKDGLDNDSLMPHIHNIITNSEFSGNEYLDMMILLGLKYRFTGQIAQDYTSKMKSLLTSTKEIDQFFDLYDHALIDLKATPADEQNIMTLLKSIDSDELKSYSNTVNELHTKGFTHVDAIDSIRAFYELHQGLSTENECVRTMVSGYIQTLLNNLEVTDFTEYFELNKIIVTYMNIFNNEKFNQEVKEVSMNYVKKCFVHFIDKRSKDYQDIKKFVSTSFVDMGFLTDKQVVEMFKTKRKPTTDKN